VVDERCGAEQRALVEVGAVVAVAAHGLVGAGLLVEAVCQASFQLGIDAGDAVRSARQDREPVGQERLEPGEVGQVARLDLRGRARE
jgi:hypothetical protein